MIFALVVAAISIMLSVLTLNPLFLLGLVLAFIYKGAEAKTEQIIAESPGYESPGCFVAIGAGSLVGLLVLLALLAAIAVAGEADVRAGIDGQSQNLREFRCALPTVVATDGAPGPLVEFAMGGCP